MQAEVIKDVKFGIISPDQAKRLSVVKLSVPDTYNEDGYPIDGGLLDQRLGVIDPGLICKTCGARAKTCPGHFGHIELVRPVIHSEFSKIIYMLLQSTCGSCHRILLGTEEIQNLKDKTKAIVAIESEELTAEEIAEASAEAEEKKGAKGVLKKIRSARKCPHCGAVQNKVKFSSPTYFYMGEKKLKPDEIRDSLAGIGNDDLRILGIDPESSRPEWLVLTYLLVPPVNVRPSITLESGERSEDDLTHKLVDIMRINQRLAQNINAGAPQIIIDDLWELLQYHVTAYFNNETSGIPPARHRSGRALKTLAQRLKGKEGRFRYNLSGKRVNYSARTVISVDPYIDLDEVGVPMDIATKLTIPFYVTLWNIEKAKELLTRTSYPMILNLISADGKRKRLIDTNREELLKELKAGDILERQLIDGDIVLFNRQPSLHRVSIMAHRVKVLPGKTFRINFCVTPPYNADFDGDEMNLHVPQTLEAQAEAKYLLEVQYQIFSPRDGEAIITNNEDGITGMYFLTKDETRLTKDEASYILGIAGIYELPKAEKNGTYKGKDVFSMLLPKDLNFETKISGGMLRISNGKLTEGVITKETYGKGNNKLLIKIGMDYGYEALKNFLFVSSKLADAYVTFAGVTVGVKEYMTNDEIEKARLALLDNTFNLVDEKIQQYKSRKLEPLIGYTRRESLERMIIVDLNIARDKAGEVLIKYIDPTNSAMQMARAGSRGSIFQYEQMSMFLGQQATLSGGRIKRGYYTRRVLPHIREGDVGPSARGFVRTNYQMGLEPIDLFMHAVGSRGSEVYKALLTARSGYLYRRLSNALQDLYIERDFSVRDTSNNIVQTMYGGDGLEPVTIQFVKLAEKENKG
jgi:DNA-directed RNA polymerase subunit A'